MTNTYVIIQYQDTFNKLLQLLDQCKFLSVDLETTGVDQLTCELVGISLCLDERPSVAYYIPLTHNTNEPQLNIDTVLGELKPRLERIPSVAHNAKFELTVLSRYGIEANIEHDTLLQAFVLGKFEELGLKYLIKFIFDHNMREFKSLFATKIQAQMNFRNVPLAVALNYAAEDALYTLRLHRSLHPQVSENKIYNLEMRLLPCTLEMERTGWQIDKDYAAREAKRLNELVDLLLEYWYRQIAVASYKVDPANHQAVIAGSMRARAEFPINSNKAIPRLVFEVLELPPQRMTKGGRPSTDDESLTMLADQNVIVNNLRILRSLIRTVPNYYEKFVNMSRDGRLYSSYNQAGATSGRYASSGPNMQNISIGQEWTWKLTPDLPLPYPSNAQAQTDRAIRQFTDGDGVGLNVTLPAVYYKTERDNDPLVPIEDTTQLAYAALGMEFYGPDDAAPTFSTKPRRMFIARPGCYIMAFDFSQVELRFMAGATKDRTLLDLYERGIDVHRRSAAVFFAKPESEVTKLERWAAKRVNFMLIYGGSPERLYTQLENRFSREVCHTLYTAFFRMYPGVAAFHRAMEMQTERTHSVTTLFGRFQVIPEFRDAEKPGVQFFMKKQLLSKARRAGVNRYSQGSCADILKFTMVRLYERKLIDYPEIRTISTLHDAEYFEVPNEIPPAELAQWIANLATKRIDGFPVFRVECSYGQNWADLQDIDFEDPYPVAYVEAKAARPVDPRRLLFDVTGMDMNRIAAIKTLLQQNPGPNLVVLRFNGRDLPLVGYETTLDDESEPLIKLTGRPVTSTSVSNMASLGELI